MFNYSIRDLERDLFKRNRKYTVMGVSVAIIHAFYMMFFIKINFLPMAIYNVFSVASYLYFGIVCAQGIKYKQLYIFVICEIPLHSVLCTYILGWNFNFMLFMYGMIPIVFYIIIFIEGIEHNILLPAITSLFLAFLYFIVRLSNEHLSPYLSPKVTGDYQHFFSYFNIALTFIMLIVFSIVFSLEYNYVNKKLRLENNTLDTFASYDTLTGLLNRRSIDSHLDSLYKEHYHDEEGFSVIMCDIDHFKSVNDTYGHDAGDYILKEVASVISSEVRDNDVVGRWGGEEFLIILGKNKDTATKLAERVRHSIENHEFEYKGTALKITITLGVSSYHSGNDISSLIRSADKKLYRGKENGRNQVVY